MCRLTRDIVPPQTAVLLLSPDPLKIQSDTKSELYYLLQITILFLKVD